MALYVRAAMIRIPTIDHVISAHKRETGLNLDSVVRLLLLLVDGDIQFVLETVLIIFILESYFQFSFQHSVPHVYRALKLTIEL